MSYRHTHSSQHHVRARQALRRWKVQEMRYLHNAAATALRLHTSKVICWLRGECGGAATLRYDYLSTFRHVVTILLVPGFHRACAEFARFWVPVWMRSPSVIMCDRVVVYGTTYSDRGLTFLTSTHCRLRSIVSRSSRRRKLPGASGMLAAVYWIQSNLRQPQVPPWSLARCFQRKQQVLATITNVFAFSVS